MANKNPFKEAIKEVQMLLEDAAEIIGTEALLVIGEHFEQEELIGVEAWKPRVSLTPRNNRKILSDTRNLQDSIDYKIEQGGAAVRIGVDLGLVPYAQIQNEGGEIQITQKMKSFFWAKYLHTGNDFYRRLALAKGTITIPARPYLQITDYMIERIEQALDNYTL